MKKLLYILLLSSFTAIAQNDTIALAQTFYKQYDLATKNAPKLADVSACIKTTEALHHLKQDKTNVSLYLANLYYAKATKFSSEASKATGFKSRGIVSAEEKTDALSKAKDYYSYFVTHYKLKDGRYRAAKNALASLENI